MLNFAPVRAKEITLQELSADLTVTDLRCLTDEMVNAMLSLIARLRRALTWCSCPRIRRPTTRYARGG